MNSLKSLLLLVITSSALSFSGCATVQRGTKMNIPIASNPERADVSVSTGQRGTTPLSVTLKRNETVQVTISKEGYKTQYFTLTPKVCVEGVAAGSMNLILGGVIGIGVDAVSGANLNLDPDHIFAELEAENSNKPTISVVDVIKLNCPLTEQQEMDFYNKLNEVEKDKKEIVVLEWGNPYKVHSTLTGLSSATFVGVRLKTKKTEKSDYEYSMRTCVINKDGKFEHFNWQPSTAIDVNKPFAFDKTEPVSLK